MASVKENLIAAKALIDTPEKWARGEYRNNGCFCAMGALGEAMGANPVSFRLTNSEEYGAVCSALPDPTLYSVWRYNDDPATTHADIMALFDRAIVAQDDPK